MQCQQFRGRDTWELIILHNTCNEHMFVLLTSVLETENGLQMRQASPLASVSMPWFTVWVSCVSDDSMGLPITISSLCYHSHE